MSATGTELMARPKAKPKGKSTRGKAAEPIPTPRTTIINLKGTEAQAEWLEGVHRKTHIAKSVIMRLALSEWAERHSHPAFPSSEDDQ